jgi:hypothetical protein
MEFRGKFEKIRKKGEISAFFDRKLAVRDSCEGKYFLFWFYTKF